MASKGRRTRPKRFTLPGVVEDQPDNNAGGAVERVTAHEAAALLGVHYNTIRNRIKAGMYCAEKVHTENGPTWMIERDSLTDNAPTSAPQQPASGVPDAQQAAIQELARAIVREAGIARDPEREAWLEGNKMAAEAAKALVIVGSGLLVGMAAVVGILPAKSTESPVLYLAFALVLLSIISGITWMQNIAEVTMSSERGYFGRWGFVAGASFVYGLVAFLAYVLLNSPGSSMIEPDTPREQLRWVVTTLLVPTVVLMAIQYFRRWRQRRRSRGEAE